MTTRRPRRPRVPRPPLLSRAGLPSRSGLLSHRSGLLSHLRWRGGDRRAVWRRGVARKWLAAVLLATAVYLTVGALRPAPPDPGPLVVVATTDLPLGATLTADSVRLRHLPVDAVPSGALRDEAQVVGSVAAAPLRAGEVVTDVRLTSVGALAGLDPDLVLAHLPLADAALASALGPGARVDVLNTLDGSTVAADVLLVRPLGAATTSPDTVATGRDAPGFLVAVTPAQAGALAVATRSDVTGHGVTVTLRP